MTRHRRLLTLLVATALFRSSQNMAVTTLALLGHTDLHLSSGTIGLLGAVTGLTLAAATILLSGRVPPEKSERSSVIGMLLLAAALATLALASSLPEMVLGTVLLGVAGGLTMPGLVNAVEHGSGMGRDRVIALYTITLSVSLAIGPLLETAILSATGQDLRSPFLAFLAFPLLGAVALAVTARPGWAPPPSSPPVPSAIDVPAGEDEAPDPAGARAERSRWRSGPLATLVATVEGRQALVVQLLYSVPFAALTSFGALVSRVGFGVSAAESQLAFTGFFAASLAARAFVAWRAPIARKRPYLWASAALTLVGLLALGFGHGVAALLVAMAVLGIPHGLTFPLVLSLVAEATDPAALPRANAALLGTTNLTAVVVPPLAGSAIPLVGYQGMVRLLALPVGALAAVFATSAPDRRPASRSGR